jgi:CMP-N,N'-diacetyllegionaminic acid synthase
VPAPHLRILGLITARGGSKGIPRKNIQLLCGKPLIQYTAEAALTATRLSRVILSTEDEEIATVGRNCGLEIPFMRPVELAKDDTPTLPVVQHAVQWLEDQGDRYDVICVLQPTNPLRRPEDIDACLKMLERSDLDSVVSVLPVPHEYNPHWVYLQDKDGHLRLSTGEETPISRRQDLPPAFHREGSIYATRRDILMNKGSLYGKHIGGYLMSAAQSVNIDGPEDWKLAEDFLSQNRNENI